MSEIERLDLVQEAMAELQAARAAAEEVVNTLPVRSGDIAVDAPEMKIEMARRRDQLNRLNGEVVRASRALEEAMHAKMMEAREILGPLQKQLAMMEEGIWTINLYLGRDEEIETLRDGKPASIDTPLSVRQMVLSMDQECIAFAEQGGIDARNMQVFKDWLLEDEANLKQVLPEERGVVVLVPRITPKDYGDPWVQDNMDKANTHSYWLLRNGERLYLMTTDMRVGVRLIPTMDEFTAMFERDRWGRVPEPGSREWFEIEERVDKRKRHYMRIALILQGLVDRTPIFHPIPKLSFSSHESYDAGTIRVITDAERAIGDGLEPFSQWHARISSQMRPGMRIICNFDGEAWRRDNYTSERVRYSRVSIPDARGLESGVIYTLEPNPDKRHDLKFTFQRTDKRWGYEYGTWGRWQENEYVRKGVTVHVDRGDTFMIPLDLVTVPEMERYLESRTERHNYMDMIPLLRSAITAKQVETNQEAPFRRLLTGKLMGTHGYGHDEETILSELDDLIRWFKLGNRWHRALVGQTIAEQQKALSQITAEYGRRLVARRGVGEEAEFIHAVRRDFPTVAFIGRYNDGTYVTYEPQEGAERTDSVGVYWTQRRWTKLGRAAKGGVTEWHFPLTTKMRSLFESEAWTGRRMALSPKDRMSGPELESLINDARKREPKLAVIMFAAKREGGRFYLWRPSKKKVVYPEHLLTGDFPSFKPEYATVTWKRARSGVQLIDRERYEDDGGFWWHESSAWSKDEANWNYPDGWSELMWRGQLADKIEAEFAEHTRQAKIIDGLYNLYTAAANSLSTQWRARSEAAEYAEFLVEYKDPDLWEGYAKTLKSDRHAFPHEISNRWGNGRFDHTPPISYVLKYVIERGIGIGVDGRTFGEIFEVAKAQGLLKDKVWRKKEDEWGRKIKMTIPDDILDLPISFVEPETEEDDDDTES
jgi:hypothetical protein